MLIIDTWASMLSLNTSYPTLNWRFVNNTKQNKTNPYQIYIYMCVCAYAFVCLLVAPCGEFKLMTTTLRSWVAMEATTSVLFN